MSERLTKYLAFQCWIFAVLLVPAMVLSYIHAGWGGVITPGMFFFIAVGCGILFKNLEDTYKEIRELEEYDE